MPTTIPPLAHFIWAGGKKLLPEEGVKNIARWIDANKDIKDFTAYLWIDKETVAKDENVVESYIALFKKMGVNVYDESNTSAKKQPYLILRDIKTNNLRDEHVAYEIDKLRPNYGSSSDLLRYRILATYGGFYCDCTDVKPGKNSLATIFSQQYNVDNIMYLEHCPQQPNATPAKIAVFGINELGNDTFATNKHNSTALKMMILARQRYTLPLNTNFLQYIVTAHTGNNIKDTTIWRTGPALVRDVLFELKYVIQDGRLLSENLKDEVLRFRDGNAEFAIPGDNTGNWLNSRITKYENSKDAIDKVIQTIKFEAKHFKVLRLDDHISDLIESTEGNIDVAKALEELKVVIEENKKNIQYTQLTGKFVETLDFVSTRKLTSFLSLTKDGLLLVVEQQCYLNDFIRADKAAAKLIAQAGKDIKTAESQQEIEAIKHAQEALRTAEEKNISVASLIIDSQRPEVKPNLCQQITLGMEYIEYLSQCLEQRESKFLNLSQPQIQEIKAYFLDRVQKYKEYATLLNEFVKPEYKVKIDKIDAFLQKLLPQNIEDTKVQSKILGQ